MKKALATVLILVLVFSLGMGITSFFASTATITTSDGASSTAQVSPQGGHTTISVGISDTVSGGDNNSGGTRSGGSGASRPASQDASKQPVNQTAAMRLAASALSASGQDSASITVDGSSISLNTMKALADAAEKSGKDLFVKSNIRDKDRSIVAQLKFNPALATNNISLSLDSERAAKVKDLAEKWLGGNAVVISFDQKGSFGMPVQVSIKADWTAFNEQGLKFYSFDSETGAIKLLDPQPRYRIDDNGFLQFDTTVAGDIIVAD